MLNNSVRKDTLLRQNFPCHCTRENNNGVLFSVAAKKRLTESKAFSEVCCCGCSFCLFVSLILLQEGRFVPAVKDTGLGSQQNKKSCQTISGEIHAAVEP